MILPVWFWPTVVVLFSWGIVGIFQKLCTNYVSAESALIWWLAGFLVLMPWLYPGREFFSYPMRSIEWALASGMLNAVGALALLAAMKSGGKASIVAPFAALYPLLVALATPFIFHESITRMEWAGIGSALVAVVLLSI